MTAMQTAPPPPPPPPSPPTTEPNLVLVGNSSVNVNVFTRYVDPGVQVVGAVAWLVWLRWLVGWLVGSRLFSGSCLLVVGDLQSGAASVSVMYKVPLAVGSKFCLRYNVSTLHWFAAWSVMHWFLASLTDKGTNAARCSMLCCAGHIALREL